ncbi:hypothetical protein AB0H00_06355 [Nocardia sp. NPDC023852]|uniref:hypothetical protein n=1 Tax=Nocardia sp. NPDC023852 TaxID=3154697 RepID=UPI0033BFFA34
MVLLLRRLVLLRLWWVGLLILRRRPESLLVRIRLLILMRWIRLLILRRLRLLVLL